MTSIEAIVISTVLIGIVAIVLGYRHYEHKTELAINEAHYQRISFHRCGPAAQTQSHSQQSRSSSSDLGPAAAQALHRSGARAPPGRR